VSSNETEFPPPAPVLYVTDLGYEQYEPADLFDLAYLLRSPRHHLTGICLTSEESDALRVTDALQVRARKDVPVVEGMEGFRALLEGAPEPLNVVVVGGYGVVAEALAQDRALFRAKVARLFLVGGYVNDYAATPFTQRLPIDPRLRDRNTERFSALGEARLQAEGEQSAFGKLLTSGEGVIWLPRDICLWRYAAPGMLVDAGEVAEFLLRELFYAHLTAGKTPDRYDAADAPVLLSALPALLLAVQPDPFAWMRLFRAITARVEVGEDGVVTTFATNTDSPNLYAVVAIDSQALSKLLTATLRERPLPTSPAS
jgi:hypothetical protein